LFEESGADAFFRVSSAAIFDDDGVDAFAMEQVRKEKPGGSGSDDPDLGAR
jgi:hypothetical protein